MTSVKVGRSYKDGGVEVRREPYRVNIIKNSRVNYVLKVSFGKEMREVLWTDKLSYSPNDLFPGTSKSS